MVLPHDTVGAFVGPPEVLAAGPPGGPLSGIALAVKDVIDVVGRVTGAGNPDLAASRSPATRSAPVVDALVAAGATVVAKTVTDELAYSLGGDNVHFVGPINVSAPGRTTGGSSSGSAAAVAAGLVPLALGTDTGGSIRVPASYCGIYGWRPTHGAVSTVGVTPLSPSFDTVGLLAQSPTLLRSAAHAALSTGPVLSTVASQPAGGMHPPLRLVIAAELIDMLDSDVAAALEVAARDRFGELPERVELGIDLDECLAAFRALQGAEAWAEHGEWITSSCPNLGAATAARFRAASEVTAERVAAAAAVRDRVRFAVHAATADGAVLIGPPAAGVAPQRESLDAAGAGGVAGSVDAERLRADTLRLSSVAGLAGVPVVVAPGGSVRVGGDRLPFGLAPFGLALIGAPGTDLALIDLVCAP